MSALKGWFLNHYPACGSHITISKVCQCVLPVCVLRIDMGSAGGALY